MYCRITSYATREDAWIDMPTFVTPRLGLAGWLGPGHAGAAGATLADEMGSGTIAQALDRSVSPIFEAANTQFASGSSCRWWHEKAPQRVVAHCQ